MAKSRPKLPVVKCDSWRSGTCAELAESQQIVVYCPKERAAHCRPGECCHHHLFKVLPLLTEMKKAGVNLKRYGSKLRDREFVDLLYSAFRKARHKRSSASSKTSGKS